MSFALIDYLKAQGKKILLIESDTSNPDVYKAHEPHSSETLICGMTNLDTSDGWIAVPHPKPEYRDRKAALPEATAPKQ